MISHQAISVQFIAARLLETIKLFYKIKVVLIVVKDLLSVDAAQDDVISIRTSGLPCRSGQHRYPDGMIS